ncbi:hypothetical protein MVES1_002022 [Malassezia vespertilionis]|uniref:Exg3p n=1 Tax=Malassezia vespertilionis TaxID=2020962 RepID=A0A2N1JBP5_9BASI|nr:uncharacterized protein MVES1_002022 [Malassezia vespertilionis]PKI83942.1 Exg3p [Malassezia vespertilionis]WFD06668.1 hypothetical protein MVES1_002022 [Malassezia vespertilionis]
MHKFFNKIQEKLDGSSSQAPAQLPPLTQPLDDRLQYQFRKQRGVNLGSWFALESWLTGSLFSQVKQTTSEYDIVQGMSAEAARDMLQNHWAHFINDGDWAWMKQHGVNSVRLPIGYFHFIAGAEHGKLQSLLKGTEYEKYGPVYAGAWNYIVGAIDKARAHGIGVLVDLHGVPGAQNTDGHSGLSSGKANFFHGVHSLHNQKATVKILVALAEAVAPYENVVGLELMNEPQNDGSLESFYDRAISAIRGVDNAAVKALPLYLGDAWHTMHYAKYVAGKSSAGNFLVLDHHLYRAFTKKDHGTAAEAHAQSIDPDANGQTAQWLQRASATANGSIIVGEWSGALNPNSFQLSQIQSKLQARTMWSQAQWRAFERYTAGYFYWTLKKEGGPDPGWCFYTAVEKGSMPPNLNPVIARGGRMPSANQMQGQLEDALEHHKQAHAQYWDAHGAQGDHATFAEGFRSAWFDASTFLATQSEIGFAGELALLRSAAFTREKGASKTDWEFEHGYKQSVQAFSAILNAS